MKVLITNHHLLDYAGSEIYTLNLAKGLRRFGHEVIIYSKFIDRLKDDFKKRRIRYVSDLYLIKNESFDIAHVHHNISAYEVRYYFPELPILFLSHGITPFLEKPPIMDLNIQQYGAVSKIVKHMLIKHNISSKNIEIMPNIVDETLFFSTTPISAKPKTALLLSSKIDEKREQDIRKACEEMGIQLSAVGQRFGWVPNKNLPKIINKCDIVFTIGRGAIETMMCGRIPFIYDIHGGCGVLTPKIFNNSFAYSFSGRYLGKNFSSNEIIKNVNKKYSRDVAKNLQQRVHAQFSIANNISNIVALYKHSIKVFRHKAINMKQLEHVVDIINNSIFYEYFYVKRNIKRELIVENKNLKMKIEVLEKNLHTIISSKTYKIWQWFNWNIKYKITLFVSFMSLILYVDTKWLIALLIGIFSLIYIIFEVVF